MVRRKSGTEMETISLEEEPVSESKAPPPPPPPVKKIETVAQPPATKDHKASEAEVAKKPLAKATAADVIKSKKMDDSAKFEIFKGMVAEGSISNKEVVNSVLHLVS